MKVARRADIPPFYVMEVMKAAGERAAAGADVVHLEVGQPSTPAPAAVIDTAVAGLRSAPIHYTDATGGAELRAAVSGWYRDRYRLDVDPGRVVITTGASGACVLAFLACFDVGDRVAVARPSYPCYRNMLTAFGIDVVDLPVGPGDRFQPTAAMVDELADRMAGRGEPLAGLVIASPSNPTGTMIRPEEMAAVAAACDRRDIRLISDEIYHGITYEEPAPSAFAHAPESCLVVQSFSKYFSMTGWRLGWLVLPPELVSPVERLAQNLTVAPPTLPQLAAAAGFTPASVEELDGHVARYARNRDVLLDGLAGAGVASTLGAPADGAFYLWLEVSPWTDDSEALCTCWLDELGVAVTPGIDFDPVDGHRFVRFSYAGSTAAVTDGTDRLATWFDGHPPR
jgi:aspartate/methionine/tyrosine aminotransferase